MAIFSQDKELLIRLAVLMKLADPTGKVVNTPTFQKLSVGIVNELMNPVNHARYMAINKDVENEYRVALQGEAATV